MPPTHFTPSGAILPPLALRLVALYFTLLTRHVVLVALHRVEIHAEDR
jgi:hypothetical protein